MTSMEPQNPVELAIKTKGSLAALGAAVGVTAQAVWKWLQAGSIPVNRVLDVERATGIPRETLRPDVFGAPRPRPRRRVSRTADLAA